MTWRERSKDLIHEKETDAKVRQHSPIVGNLEVMDVVKPPHAATGKKNVISQILLFVFYE